MLGRGLADETRYMVQRRMDTVSPLTPPLLKKIYQVLLKRGQLGWGTRKGNLAAAV